MLDAFLPYLLPISYAILVICLYWYLTVPKGLPAGPLGLPFIGSSLDTWNASKQFVSLQRWARKYGSVYKVYVGGKMVLVLADWAAIHEALVKKGDVFAGRPRFSSFQPPGIPHNHGIVFSDGQVWKVHRQFANSTLREFGFGRSSLEPRIKEELEFLIGEIDKTNGETFDVEKMVENAVSNIICVMMFGRRYDYRDPTFRSLLNIVKLRANQSSVGFLSPFILSPWLSALLAFTPAVTKFKQTAVELIGVIKKFVDSTVATFDPDAPTQTNYVHAFLKMRQQELEEKEGQPSSTTTPTNFTEAQLIQIAIELFAAGTETTANTLRWVILYMAHSPDIQEKMYEEIKGIVGPDGDYRRLSLSDRGRLPFTEAVIMETVRISYLVPLSVMHRTVAPTKLFNYDIPADTLVIPLLSAVLTDPITYPKPGQFDPYRFLDAEGNLKKDPKWIPFSLGKRICLGEMLAKMELFLFFTGLFLNFKFEFPDDQPKPEIKGSIGFTHIPLPYKIKAIPRE